MKLDAEFFLHEFMPPDVAARLEKERLIDKEPYVPSEIDDDAPEHEEEPAKKRTKTTSNVEKKKNDVEVVKDTDNEEEDDDDSVIACPNPEEARYGVEKVVFAAGGPMNIINPAFRENIDAYKHWPNGRPVVWVEARIFAPDTNLFVCKGYSKHLIDPALIKRLHSYTNGMLNRWRQSSICILKQVLNTHSFRRELTENQLSFATKDVLKAMAGIAKLDTFPVHILNRDSAQALVKGIDTAEMAEFVLRMANCTYFSIIAYPKPNTNTFELLTRFDMNNKNKKAYGRRRYKMVHPTPCQNNGCRNRVSSLHY